MNLPFRKLLFVFFLCFCFGIQSSARVHAGKWECIFQEMPTKENDSLRHLLDSIDHQFMDGKYKKAILQSMGAMKLAQKKHDTVLVYYSRYVIAAAFMFLEDYKSAHKYANQYTAYAEKTQDTFKMARAYTLQGAIAVQNKKYRKGLANFQQAEPLTRQSLQLGVLYYNYAECYLYLKNLKDAKRFYGKAKEISELKKFKDLLTGLKLMDGKIKLQEGKPKEAVKSFKVGLANATENNLKDYDFIQSYKAYSNALFQLERYKEAFEARRVFDSLNAEAQKREQIRAVQNANAEYDVEGYKHKLLTVELQKRLSIQKAEKNKILAYISIGFAVFMIVIIILFFRNYEKRKRLLVSLKEKNKQYLFAKNEAEDAVAAKSRFFSTVSHELRTPLYGVIGLTSILLQDKSLQSHEKDLKQLKFSADYLVSLINDVLQLNKIESKKLKQQSVRFGISDLVQSIVTSLEYINQQNKNKLQLTIDNEIPAEVIGNKIILSQILVNLMSNACKFTQNGCVEVRVKLQEETTEEVKLLFTVKDDGVGIAADQQKYIFEEFSQSKDKTGPLNQQGTGLGLAIVQKLLEAVGSKIYLRSKKEKGSTFWFSLTFEIGEETTVAQQPTTESLDILVGKEILIVDDNRINQMVTKKILENHGMKAFLAESGEVALNLLRKYKYDLVLMDLNMPGKSGADTTREIRKFNTYLPVIALTAMEIEHVQEDIEAAGMTDFIEKPYDIQEFLRKMEHHLAS